MGTPGPLLFYSVEFCLFWKFSMREVVILFSFYNKITDQIGTGPVHPLDKGLQIYSPNMATRTQRSGDKPVKCPKRCLA